MDQLFGRVSKSGEVKWLSLQELCNFGGSNPTWWQNSKALPPVH